MGWAEYTAFVSAGQASAGTRVAARLVGREDVIVVVRQRWAEAGEGSGRFLLLAGEAGIGKSRMLHEVAEALGGPSTVTTRAWPRDAEVPGAVLIDLARALRQEGEESLADALLDRLLGHDDQGDPARRHRLLVGDLAWTSWSRGSVTARPCSRSRTCTGPTSSASKCSSGSRRWSRAPRVS